MVALPAIPPLSLGFAGGSAGPSSAGITDTGDFFAPFQAPFIVASPGAEARVEATADQGGDDGLATARRFTGGTASGAGFDFDLVPLVAAGFFAVLAVMAFRKG